MKISFVFLLLLFLGFNSSNAQTCELGLSYQPHKFYLTNKAEKLSASGYSEVLPNIFTGNCVGVLCNLLLNKQNSLQFNLNFMHQKQYYLYAGLSDNKSNISTSLNSINLSISHNLYLWEYENDDNVFFSYGVSAKYLIDYTDYYNVEIVTKTNGVTQKEVRSSIIENTKSVSTVVVSQNDTIISIDGDAKISLPRYNSFNAGVNFGLHFLHYFTDNLAFTVGANGMYYFLDPENKASAFWSSTSKYKYGSVATADKREATKMYSYGLSLSLIYCLNRD